MNRILNNIFDAKIARRGSIVRRSIKSLKENGCYEELIRMARERGYLVFEIGDQVVVICSPDPHFKRVA